MRNKRTKQVFEAGETVRVVKGLHRGCVATVRRTSVMHNCRYYWLDADGFETAFPKSELRRVAKSRQ